MFSFNSMDLVWVMPECVLLALACVVLVFDLFISAAQKSLTYLLSLLGLVLVAVALVNVPAGTHVILSGMFVSDGVALFLKLVALIATAAVMVYSHEYLKVRGLLKGEYFVLILFALLGIFVMASARNLLAMYMGIELLALSQYALVAFDRDSGVAAESAMKYFVLGAIASGLMLYGISILYGVGATLDLQQLSQGLMAHGPVPVGYLFGLAFLVCGIAFKLGAVPFHMWVPDVYQGAPTAVSIFLGSAPKLAYFALTFRVLSEGLAPLAQDWQQILVVLSVLSLIFGNVVAVAQTNIKRLLAYSTISNIGFIILGFAAATPFGYASALFYTTSYVLLSLGAFAMILLLSRQGFEAERIEDFKGLAQKSPWFAWMMLFLMVSTAGVPPFIGFFAKLYVIQAILAQGMTALAVVAVVTSVIGAFYYLRVIKVMFFDEPQDHSAILASPSLKLLLSLNGLAALVLGVFNAPLWGVIESLFSSETLLK
jgi:NADH-quinone oxidoreductase subunit N